jgi:uroporphyrinogen decarboxylase
MATATATDTRKTDLFAALECRQPAGAVPIWELEFHGFDAISGQHLVLGSEFEKLSSDQQQIAIDRNAEIILSVCDELHYSAVTAPSGYWYQSPGQLAYLVLPESGRYKQIQALSRMSAGRIAVIASTGGVMTANYDEDFCDKLYNQPETIDEYARNLVAGGIENAKRIRDLGAEVVFTASDIADNSGPFFSPPQMQRFILPYLTQWSAKCREMGLYTILHSDGNLTSCLNDIAQTGIHALQAVDPIAGMDMRKAKDIVAGRLCLCGNVDCGLLVRGNPQQVFDATRNLLTTCKDSGGLVLGASNAVQAEVPPENYRAMIAAWKQFGQY